MELAIYLILLVFLATFAITFGRPFFRGAPFAPTDKKTVTTMLSLAAVRPGERACDIGSGDGRIVVALAQAGADVDGFEINPFLVLWSRQRIIKNELQQKARVYRSNLWKVDYRPYDIVALFGIPYIMKGLEQKLLAELKPGARVLSNRFSFPNWQPVKKESGVYLYVKSA